MLFLFIINANANQSLDGFKRQERYDIIRGINSIFMGFKILNKDNFDGIWPFTIDNIQISCMLYRVSDTMIAHHLLLYDGTKHYYGLNGTTPEKNHITGEKYIRFEKIVKNYNHCFDKKYIAKNRTFSEENKRLDKCKPLYDSMHKISFDIGFKLCK